MTSENICLAFKEFHTCALWCVVNPLLFKRPRLFVECKVTCQPTKQQKDLMCALYV